MDWVWTDTTLSLSNWMCVEDIYANIFIIKCSRETEKVPGQRGWMGTSWKFTTTFIAAQRKDLSRTLVDSCSGSRGQWTGPLGLGGGVRQILAMCYQDRFIQARPTAAGFITSPPHKETLSLLLVVPHFPSPPLVVCSLLSVCEFILVTHPFCTMLPPPLNSAPRIFLWRVKTSTRAM